MEEKDSTTTESIKNEIERILGELSTEGINQSNIDYIGKLIDAHKDISNEKYWEVKEMRYNNYRRDDYDDMSYGRRRRDSRGRYRGDDMLDEMREHYDTYNRGRSYGGRETTESLEYMMQSAYEFICMLEEEANTDEEMNIIRKYARKISEL